MELKGNIKDYTLNRFIEEVGVSKTSNFKNELLNDSKQLTEKQRYALRCLLYTSCPECLKRIQGRYRNI